MKRLAFACILAVLIPGCASTETTEAVKAAQGQGTARIYEFAYEPVFNAAIGAAKTKQLEVVESDKNSGRLLFSHGVTIWSWGERIAVFVSRVSDKTTRVEIVSKPIMETLNFPPDWQNILLEQVASELKTGKY